MEDRRMAFTANDLRMAAFLGMLFGAFIVMVLNKWWA